MTKLRIGRIPVGEACDCEAVASVNCKRFAHGATHRIEAVDTATGVVWRKSMCTPTTAAIAAKRGVPFPTRFTWPSSATTDAPRTGRNHS